MYRLGCRNTCQRLPTCLLGHACIAILDVSVILYSQILTIVLHRIVLGQGGMLGDKELCQKLWDMWEEDQ